MKTIVHNANARDKLLHIEAEGCIINIRVGLVDMTGHNVVNISVQCDQYSGEPAWSLDGGSKHIGFRVVQETEQEYAERKLFERMLRIQNSRSIKVVKDE